MLPLLVNDTFDVEAAAIGCAVTLYVPATQFDVQLTFARPLVSVIANGDESEHVAPVDGALKSTRTLGAGLPAESRTVTWIVEPLAVAAIVAPGGARTAP